jgi:hypothetical protein
MTPTQLATILGIDRKSIIAYLSSSSIRQAHIKCLYLFALSFEPEDFIRISKTIKEELEKEGVDINTITKEFIDETTLSELTGYTKNTLRVWRSKNLGPPFTKFELERKRAVIRYKVGDVKEWLSQKDTKKEKKHRNANKSN